ncbi:hypothetical protein BTO02_00760 [Paraburkholderia sp. SOS3]|nr:hypothetical protein BTO02_00760 [Paraburkholderia sp. SOS3]
MAQIARNSLTDIILTMQLSFNIVLAKPLIECCFSGGRAGALLFVRWAERVAAHQLYMHP